MENKLILGFRSFSETMGFLTIVAGSLVMVGWIFDIQFLKSILPQHISMMPNTALCFILIGIASLSAQDRDRVSRPKRIYWLAYACAFIACTISVLTIAEYLYGVDLGIDQAIFKDTSGVEYPGRMAPVTSVNFIVLSLSIFLLDVRTRSGRFPFQWLALFVGSTALTGTIGYLFGVRQLYYPKYAIVPMAMNTATLFCVVFLSVFFLRPGKGLTRPFTSDTLSGSALRYGSVFTIVIMVILNFLEISGRKAGLHDGPTGAAVFTVVAIIAFLVVLWIGASLLYRTERWLQEATRRIEEDKHLVSVGLMAAAVAHRLRTPLAAIRLATGNIKYNTSDTAIGQHLANIDKKVLESDEVINNMLSYSLQLRRPHYEDLDIRDVIKGAVEEVKRRFPQHGSVIGERYDLLDQNMIQGDAFQLRQLLVNVIDNAYDAVLADGRVDKRITVYARYEGGRIVISVSDNGPGIDGEDLNRIGNPFFTTKPMGLGIGFAVCKQIIRFHNGEINIDSKKGEGTEITITLPVRQPD